MMREQDLRSGMLLGEQALETLRGSHVAVFGLGGVGSYTAEALARMGIGRLTLVDHDSVSITNLNRQLYALHSTLGQNKAELAKRRVLDINPGCVVSAKPVFYSAETAGELFAESFHAVADAIDTVSSKIDLAVRTRERGIPLVSCMGTGNKLDGSLFRVSTLEETSVCPLCRVMRRELRARGIAGLRVVWSPEEPLTPDSSLLPEKSDTASVRKRAVPGSVSFVPPVAGMLLAGEIIRILLKGTAL